ncbi:FMN-binding negative transcriptional regulator [Dongia soli]|uniref:FMN-binding negative transcriptional regulator n=1 Tax=Dongia soli TaxID=600628 RepID=A0ABU5E5A8_9PROT|nr:FMN-binding negative transcriptional regulator [Dongia soli]MDY0881500.1 FMN-binding negative transcriptional regulator [Dongia soli]
MYVPTAFQESDPAVLRQIIREARLCNFVTATQEGLVATPLPLFLNADEGEHGVLYGHLAKANPQWKMTSIGDALAIFVGGHAYITPSWYASKAKDEKVVPTWNYEAVHAYGPAEFFEDADRLLDVVTRLTNLHESERAKPWAVSDAPADYIKAQLRGIVGIRMPITRLQGKRKMSQNRNAEDRAGVARGLAESDRMMDRYVGGLIPLEDR